MTCEGFERRLDALLDGSCTEADWREAEARLKGAALPPSSGKAGPAKP